MDRTSKAEIEARIAEEIERRRERGEPFQPVEALRKRGALCEAFWGETWCGNLESYSDYADRLPRGKSYLRAGNVYDLTIDPGEIFAYVTGAEIYEVLIRIDPVDDEAMEKIEAACAGQTGSVLDLLAGKLGDSAMAVLTDLDFGLIPRPDEIHFSCSCPDWAGMCKHVAATLYAVGVQLDQQPELLFTLRQADPAALASATLRNAGSIAAKTSNSPGPGFGPEDLSDLFGIEISEPEAAFD